MLKEHLHILRCPLTGEKLFLTAKKYAEDGHIESGELVSSDNTYQIMGGIPRFIFPQSNEERQTVQAFGAQWYEADSFSLTYGQNAEYFSSYLHPLHPDEFRGSIILDAGCGNGRLIEYAIDFNPKLIVGLDYSHSVELAFNRTRHCKNVLIVQGSILSPPLSRNNFNIIYSLGVIHHLEVPEKGLVELGRLLNQSGKMHIWTYSREGNEIYLTLVRPLRWVAKKMTKRALWSLSSCLAFVTWPYLWACSFTKDRFPLLSFPMQDYLSFIYKSGFKIYELVIHDQLAPSIVFYPTKDEIQSWAKIANLQIFHMDMRTNNSWRVGLKEECIV